MLKNFLFYILFFTFSSFALEVDKNPYLMEILEQNKDICVNYRLWNTPNQGVFNMFRVPICDCVMTRFMTDLKNEQFMYLRDKKVRKYIAPYMKQYLQDCSTEISEEYIHYYN
ncbi:MAG: hypothetical protein LBC92_01140 [Rickettsiales bacterium]|jgi:hypothetical protein|nr:hypothetical protein [Rickettsiales bacterium]